MYHEKIASSFEPKFSTLSFIEIRTKQPNVSVSMMSIIEIGTKKTECQRL